MLAFFTLALLALLIVAMSWFAHALRTSPVNEYNVVIFDWRSKPGVFVIVSCVLGVFCFFALFTDPTNKRPLSLDKQRFVPEIHPPSVLEPLPLSEPPEQKQETAAALPKSPSVPPPPQKKQQSSRAPLRMKKDHGFSRDEEFEALFPMP